MPTYDLRCEERGTRFERFFARILREADKVCPTCGSERVTTLISGGYLKPAQPAGGASCGDGGRFG